MANSNLSINGVSVGLVPTGTDNVPTITASDRIMEEKISFQLWSEYFSGNLEKTIQSPSNRISCDLTVTDGRHFCSCSLTKNPQELVLLHQSPYDLPDYGTPLNLVPELRNVSIWSLLHRLSPYKTIQSAAYHLGEEQYGYSAFKLSGYHFSLGKFPASRLEQYRSDISEECALQWKIVSSSVYEKIRSNPVIDAFAW